MATRNIVPRANNEGSIGTPTKNWQNGYFTDLTLSGLMASLPVITDVAKKFVSIAYTGAVSFRKNLGLEPDAEPTFANIKLSSLTDGYVPYHVSDALGLADSPIVTDGIKVGVGTGGPDTPVEVYHVPVANNIYDDVLKITSFYALGAFPGFGPAIIFSGTNADWTEKITGRIATALEGSGLAGMAFYTQTSASSVTEKVRIDNAGNVVILGTTPQSTYELTVNNDIYAVGDVSALTFTDRTDFFEGDALAAILGIKSKGGKLDHASLPAFAQAHRKSNIEEEQTVTKTRQKTIRVKKPVSSEEVKLIKGKYTKVITVQEQEIDESVFEEYDLYNEKGKKILDKDGNPIKHKVPIMEEYQVTEKVKIGEEDVVYRNLGNMVSLLTVGIQQLDVRVRALEA